MKQLFKNGITSTLFFDNETTVENLACWVNENFDLESNLFNLNEIHSCMISIMSNSVFIHGDEDSVELTLETVSIIKT